MKEVPKSELVPALRLPEFQHKAPWSIARGGELFDQISNKNHSSDLPILAITQEQGAVPRDHIDYHVTVSEKSVASYKVVEPGDFIISLRSFQGGIEFSEYLGLCSPAYVILRLRGEQDPRFFKHLFKTQRFIEELSREIEGVRDGKMVSYKQFSTIRISTPVQHSEMERVADVLDSVDRLIEAETEKLDALKGHKQGLMQQLFPVDDETLPRLRFPEFADQPGWIEHQVSNVASITTGGRDTQNKDDSGVYPFFVRSQNVERINSYSLDCEAVLTSGDGVGVGKNFHYINGKFDFHQRVYCIYNFKPEIKGRFFYYFFAHNFFPRVSAMSAKNSVDSVRMAMIAEMPVFIPSLAEQEKITSTLVAVDELITSQIERVRFLTEHKLGLLQQLFPVLDEVDG